MIVFEIVCIIFSTIDRMMGDLHRELPKLYLVDNRHVSFFALFVSQCCHRKHRPVLNRLMYTHTHTQKDTQDTHTYTHKDTHTCFSAGDLILILFFRTGIKVTGR